MRKSWYGQQQRRQRWLRLVQLNVLWRWILAIKRTHGTSLKWRKLRNNMSEQERERERRTGIWARWRRRRNICAHKMTCASFVCWWYLLWCGYHFHTSSTIAHQHPRPTAWRNIQSPYAFFQSLMLSHFILFSNELRRDIFLIFILHTSKWAKIRSRNLSLFIRVVWNIEHTYTENIQEGI